MKPSINPLVAIAATALLSVACSDTATDPLPTTGSLTVSVSTTGDDLDADGYTLTVGTDERSVTVDGSATFADLEAGMVSVTLGDLADNCMATETSPQSVTIVAGETATAAFTVTCDAIPEVTLVAADRDGNVYTVDAATGVESLLFTPMADDGVGGTEMLGVISSMAHIPATDAWWLGMGGQSVCPTRDACVMVEDTVSGSPTEGLYVVLGEIDPLSGVSGLAVHPSTGKIYTFQSDSGGELYELDPVTVAETVVLSGLSEGGSGKGTTFSNDGLLYVFGEDELTEIDIDAGTDTLIGTWTLTGFPTLLDPTPTIGSLATRVSDGTVFGILKDGGGGRSTTTTYLVTVNLATAEVTNVGVNTNLLDGLAYIPTRLIS